MRSQGEIWRLIAFVIALLGAQWALAEHGVAHAMASADTPCIECLAAPGWNAPPASSPRLPEPLFPRMRPAGKAQLGVAAPLRLPYHGRAPPALPCL
ncbi:MAG: hypothetical protein N2441_00630 [Rhodocyclaceae bacterium]|nr:hypothetical protein [Rhodocyclaceae bacterium]